MPLPAILSLCLQSLPRLAVPTSPTVRVASFGIPDTLFLVVLALIVFGPKKLPEISRQIGKLLYEFRKASNDFKFQIEEELRASEQAERQKQLAAQAAAPQPATPVAITAGETVSAEPATPEAAATDVPKTDASTKETIISPTAETASGPTIQPPASGLPVSSRSPYRAIESAENTSAAAITGESLDEMQADAQEAVRTAAADPSYKQPGESQANDPMPSDPVPTHHG